MLGLAGCPDIVHRADIDLEADSTTLGDVAALDVGKVGVRAPGRAAWLACEKA